MGEEVVQEVVAAVESEVKAVEAAVVKYSTEARIAVTTEEALVMAKMEAQFMKGQVEIQRLTQICQNIGQQFPKEVEKLMAKYSIDPKTHSWDPEQSAFIKKA